MSPLECETSAPLRESETSSADSEPVVDVLKRGFRFRRPQDRADGPEGAIRSDHSGASSGAQGHSMTALERAPAVGLQPRHSMAVGDFFDGAVELRRAYDEQLGTPGDLSHARFVWELFHRPHSTYLRTDPSLVFSDDLNSAFQKRLSDWGAENLGCARLHRPLLSCHLDGFFHSLHADPDHGPWAYVFSLTDWENRAFTGGETYLLRSSVLDYWRQVSEEGSTDFFDLIEPQFNQLTVFDSRIPHGVCTVHGTQDLLAGRVVLVGWFDWPEVIKSEDLTGQHWDSILEEVQRELELRLADFQTVNGVLTTRLDLLPEGRVGAVKTLGSTLVSTAGDSSEPERCEKVAHNVLLDTSFPKAPVGAWVSIPLRLPIRAERQVSSPLRDDRSD